MSQENVEIVRRVVEATNRSDLAALDTLWTADAEFHSTFAAAEGRTFRGLQGIRDYFATLGEVFDELRIEIEGITEVDQDRLVVLVGLRGRGKESGAVVEAHHGHVWTIRDRKVKRIVSYLAPADAFEAVGLRE